MARTLICIVLSLAIVFQGGTPALAQQRQQPKDQKSITVGPRRQLATIIFAGLAGAILGLSTLSFYGRPQDKLENIGIGLAVGIISGTVYTTYKAATQPRQFYNYGPSNKELNGSSFRRPQRVWPESFDLNTPEKSSQKGFQVSYQWSF